jgi:hypothetical protein
VEEEMAAVGEIREVMGTPGSGGNGTGYSELISL